MANRRDGPSGLVRFTTDEDLKNLSFEDIVRRLRWCENERARLLAEQSNGTKDLRQQLMLKSEENQRLKAENQKLSSDNQELRDLCCFLDDDRQKGRKLSSEWQRFGQYTANVMRNGVSTYQDKLKELEERQEKLLRDNLELRELCFLLDQERTGNQSTLLSVSSVVNSGDAGKVSMVNGPSSLANDGHFSKDGSSKIMWGSGDELSQVHKSDQSNHVHYMEDRVRSLEEETRAFTQSQPRRNGPVPEEELDGHTPNHVSSASNSIHPSYPSRNYGPNIENGNVAPNSPKAMVNALKVLEVHDMLDRQTPVNHVENEHMNTNEKAIVREMCNVVWRKLGDNPAPPGNGAANGGKPSQRPPAPPRYSTSTINPPRPSGFTTPPYSGGSTSSLERKGL